VLLDIESPAPAHFFEAVNPGGAPCYEMAKPASRPTPPPPTVMTVDDAHLDLPVHITAEIEAINADPDMPWTAGTYDMWAGKTRRDTLYRYGTKMASLPDLARLPLHLEGAADANFIAPVHYPS
jgi:hypothetical protein